MSKKESEGDTSVRCVVNRKDYIDLEVSKIFVKSSRQMDLRK